MQPVTTPHHIHTHAWTHTFTQGTMPAHTHTHTLRWWVDRRLILVAFLSSFCLPLPFPLDCMHAAVWQKTFLENKNTHSALGSDWQTRLVNHDWVQLLILHHAHSFRKTIKIFHGFGPIWTHRDISVKEMLWRDSCYSFLMIYILNVYMLESRWGPCSIICGKDFAPDHRVRAHSAQF